MKNRNQIVINIIDAFEGVELDGGISLNMTEYYDSGGTNEEYEKRAQLDERYDWLAIEDEVLESFTVTFSFTDSSGFKFYIPAYMNYSLLNFEKSDSSIIFGTIYSLNPDLCIYEEEHESFLETFNQEQINCIKDFLYFFTQQNDKLYCETANKNWDKIKSLTRSRKEDFR